jgi:hypothetical protein
MEPEGDLQQLPQMIIQWKQVQEEGRKLKEQLRENKIREKAYSEVILRVMKKNSIGALDLKQSKNRILCQTKQKKGSLGKKNLQDSLCEYLKSEEAGKKAFDFISEKQGTKTFDTLVLEKL